ncbi:MAG: AAA family ATPase, partial [Clostridia bacterium]|nr:AAA family ATPase [Clostridia bacterium]
MLRSLRIENVAVIEQAEIEFDHGFCVLTGETGAGKSILIDSLNAVLGCRTSKDIVRRGSSKAVVNALFEDCSKAVLQRLEELGIPTEDDSVLLNRTITADGRSTCRINGFLANTAVLRQLAVLLVNIHGQQDNHTLLDSSAHGGFVDQLIDNPSLLSDYREAYTHLKELQEMVDQLQMDEADKARRMDMLRYQVEELIAADLQIGEYEQLTARKKTAANSEKIAMALQTALAALEGEDLQVGCADLAQSAADAMAECTRFMEMNGLEERLQSLAYELDAAKDEIRSLTEELVFDPRELAS